jgi:hypothetical protein
LGITYGDHLIDSGHRELTPEQEREIDDQAQQKMQSGQIVNPWEAEVERLRTIKGELQGLLFGVRNQDAFLDMPKYLRDAINKALDQP